MHASLRTCCLAAGFLTAVLRSDLRGAEHLLKEPNDRPPVTSWEHIGTNNKCIRFVDRNTGWAVGSAGTIMRSDDAGVTWQRQQSPTSLDLTSLCFVDKDHGWIAGSRGLILVTTNGGSSWTQQESGTGNWLASIWFSDSQRGWVAGENGTILLTNDGGKKWRLAETHVDTTLMALTFVSPLLGWAAGGYGTILVTDDAGESWHRQANPLNTALQSIWMVDEKIGCAVGKAGIALTTSDGGQHWEPRVTGTTDTLNGVCFADRQHGWACGENGRLISSSDGGKSWTQMATGTDEYLYSVHVLPDRSRGWIAGGYGIVKLMDATAEGIWKDVGGASTTTLRATSFIDANFGWAVGTNGSILKTIDGGHSWSDCSSATSATLDGVCFLDRNRGWAVGVEGTIQKTSNGGISWEKVPLPAVATGSSPDLWQVFFVSSTHGWIVGEEGTVLRTENGGASWSRQTVGSKGVNGVFFCDAEHGWAVGDNGLIQRYISKNGSWAALPIATKTRLWQLWFADFDCGWACGEGGVIYHTEDGGNKWMLQESGVREDLFAIQFVNHKVGWAFGNGGAIRFTSDGGGTWSKQEVPTIANLWAAKCFDESHALAVGEQGTVLLTADGGKNWNITRSSKPRTVRDVQFSADLRTGWAVGERGMVWSTKNQGRTWRQHESGITSDLNAVRFTNQTTGWAIGSKGIILHTRDGGGSWQSTASDTTRTLCAVSFAGPSHGWTSGMAGTILHTSDGGSSWHHQDNGSLTADLLSISFCRDAIHGCAVGVDGTILTTATGGAVWEHRFAGTKVALRSVHFAADGRHAWAVGDEGTVISTTDGGETWRSQRSGTHDDLLRVVFSDNFHGWAVGSGATVVATADGGNTWLLDVTNRSSFLRTTSFAALDVIPQPPGASCDAVLIAFWGSTIFGNDRVVEGMSIGRSSAAGPYVSRWSDPTATATNKVSLNWRVAGTPNSSIACVLQPLVMDQRGDVMVELPTLKASSTDGRTFTTTWDASASHVAPGTELVWRVICNEGASIQYAQVIPFPFVYQPLWERLGPWAHGAIMLGLALASIMLLLLALILVHPIGIVAVCDHKDIFAALEKLLGGTLARSLLEATLLPRMVRSTRVVSAWSAKCRVGVTKLTELSPLVQTSYLSMEQCLDAWVEAKFSRKPNALDLVETFKRLNIYIEIPVRVGRSGATLDPPRAQAFQNYFREHEVIQLVGDGGTGKTTLACKLARWAASRDRRERLFPTRQVLPVLLEEDFSDLVQAIQVQLRKTFGFEDLDEDGFVVRALLRGGQVLPIIDGLSEKLPETQHAVVNAHGKAEIRTLLVTTRRPFHFDGKKVCLFYPDKLVPNRLMHYLTRLISVLSVKQEGEDQMVTDQHIAQIAQHLSDAVAAGGPSTKVTPLFARIYVEEALRILSLQHDLKELSASIPEALFQYLRIANAGTRGGEVLPDEILTAAVKALGWCALRPNYTPQPFSKSLAIQDLKKLNLRCENSSVPADRILRRLQQIGILEALDSGDASRVSMRFTLDPLAEYMAAIYWIEAIKDDVEWTSWLRGILADRESADEIYGFLTALKDCSAVYRRDCPLLEEFLR
jgi:photosystem II stability/assembly factor-like uncharacterized protein